MEENVSVYKVGLSTVGGLIIGAFAWLAGMSWERALGSSGRLRWKTAALGAIWGMTVVQLTPTGGVIMENKTTVNYSVIALHGWIAFFVSLLAGVAWIARSLARTVKG